MKAFKAFLLAIGAMLSLMACNSIKPSAPAQSIILRPEDFVEGEASITLDKLSPDESVAVIPVFATQDYQPDGFAFSIRTEHIKPHSAGPSVHPQSLEDDPYHSNHLEILEESKAIVEDLRNRGVKPLSGRGVRTQAFDKCPAPYTPGKQCRFWIRTGDEMVQITATLQKVSPQAYWFVQNQDLGDLSASDIDRLVKPFEEISIPINTRYFGTPVDVDHNGKTIIVFSSLLNVLGYVFAVDLFPDGTLSSARSNEADIFYAATPKSKARSMSREEYFRDGMPSTLTHEFKHLIALSNRVQQNLPLEESWLEEPSAMAAQQLAGQGSQTQQFQPFAADALAAPQNFRVTYQGRPSNPAEQRSMYGYNFLFLWCIAEAVGHQTFWPALVQSQPTGIAGLEALSGKSFADLMLDWSLSMLFDHTDLLSEHTYQDLDLRDGTWEALGYKGLEDLSAKTRSVAYYLGRGQGTDSTITVQTNYNKPYVIVVRFKGTLPW